MHRGAIGEFNIGGKGSQGAGYREGLMMKG